MDIDPADGREFRSSWKPAFYSEDFSSEIAAILLNRGKLRQIIKRVEGEREERGKSSRKSSTVRLVENEHFSTCRAPRYRVIGNQLICRCFVDGAKDRTANVLRVRRSARWRIHKAESRKRAPRTIASSSDRFPFRRRGWHAVNWAARRVRRKSSAGTWSHRWKCQVNCRRMDLEGRERGARGGKWLYVRKCSRALILTLLLNSRAHMPRLFRDWSK